MRFRLSRVQHETDKQQICRELTRRRFSPCWSAAQVDYYEKSSVKLETWDGYFLSFTNYNPSPGDVLAVNVEHRRLIRRGLQDKQLDPAIARSQNRPAAQHIFGASPNYCKMEFDAAVEDDDRMLIFVMPNLRKQFIAKSDIGIAMHLWHDTICAHDPIELDPETKNSALTLPLRAIRERVVEPVKIATQQLFDSGSVPL